MNKPAALLKKAQALAAKAESWADLSNALFDANIGIVSRAYQVGGERSAFMKTPEYKKIRKLVSDAKDRFGLLEGSTPKASGKFVVRLPKLLHNALKQEALDEGVSLNQLVVFKLAAQLNFSRDRAHKKR